MKPKLGVCAFCLWMFVSILDQPSHAQQVRPLSIVGTSSVPNLVAEAIASPVKCDADGNIALRAIISSDDLGPIVRLSADGQKAVSVRLSHDTEPRDAELIDFALGRGELFVLALSKSRPWIFRYDADGKFERAVPIDAQIEAARLAVDANENLLISGQTLGEGGKLKGTFLGLFRSDGTLIREVVIQKNSTSSPSKKDSYAHELDTARTSLLLAGRDGNLYFLQGSTLYIVSSSGMVHRIHVHPPKGVVKTGTLVADQRGRVAVEFLVFKPGTQNGEIKSVILQVIDPHNRAPMMTLSHSNAQIGPTLACYDDETFVFVNTDDKSHLELVKTKPQ
jgi:hypothetical protein